MTDLAIFFFPVGGHLAAEEDDALVVRDDVRHLLDEQLRRLLPLLEVADERGELDLPSGVIQCRGHCQVAATGFLQI